MYLLCYIDRFVLNRSSSFLCKMFDVAFNSTFTSAFTVEANTSTRNIAYFRRNPSNLALDSACLPSMLLVTQPSEIEEKRKCMIQLHLFVIQGQ